MTFANEVSFLSFSIVFQLFRHRIPGLIVEEAVVEVVDAAAGGGGFVVVAAVVDRRLLPIVVVVEQDLQNIQSFGSL